MQLSSTSLWHCALAAFLYVCVASFPGAVHAAGSQAVHAEDNDPTYLRTLISQASKKKLAETRLWHLLLHYKPRRWGGVNSEADGQGFFFHPRGKINPHREMEATLRAFFSAVPDVNTDKQWQHPQCRFPARYHWLKAQLSFDPHRLPEQACPRFDVWRLALAPGSVSLIFASYYMNNPASMFGHTFLRLNHKARQGAQKLLDYGVNYAATPTTTNGFLYAYLGTVGGFKGQFANFPYYLKVQEYSNLDSRDLWEYDLQFNQEQIDRMLRHLWELGSTHFWYYFFQENCSYHILSLLEVANPQLHLTDQFFFHVIPAETIRLITQQEGLVGDVVYRPSILSQFAQKRHAMTSKEVTLLRQSLRAKSLYSLEGLELDAAREALVLDAALDLVQHHKLKNKNKLPPADKAFRRELLVRRSRLGVPSPPVPQLSLSSRPELGHGTFRLRLAGGINEDEKGFVELSFPSFHDLLDPEEGFAPYSHIQLLTLTLRYYTEAQRLDLERLDLVRVTSLSPLDFFVKTPSWRVNIGYHALRDLACRRCHWFKMEGGIGGTVRLNRSASSLAYAFVNLEVGLSKAFEGVFRFAPGLMVGAMFQPLRAWKVQAGGAVYYPALGGNSMYYRNYVHQHIAVTRQLGIRLELNHFKTILEGLVALHIYL